MLCQHVQAHKGDLCNTDKLQREHKSRNAQEVEDWVVGSGDDYSVPFVIVEKVDARDLAFDADGQLLRVA